MHFGMSLTVNEFFNYKHTQSVQGYTSARENN